ncbi:hypothetical protein EJB05_30306, partial [Eragrostis curvula]
MMILSIRRCLFRHLLARPGSSKVAKLVMERRKKCGEGKDERGDKFKRVEQMTKILMRSKRVAPSYATFGCSPAALPIFLVKCPEHLKTRIWGNNLGFQHCDFTCDGIDDRALAMYLMNHIKFNPLRIEIKGPVFANHPYVFMT